MNEKMEALMLEVKQVREDNEKLKEKAMKQEDIVETL